MATVLRGFKEEYGLESQHRKEIFLFFTAPIPALGLTQDIFTKVKAAAA
jgi:hypothetical protein